MSIVRRAFLGGSAAAALVSGKAFPAAAGVREEVDPRVLDAARALAQPTIIMDGTEGDIVLRLGGSPRLPSPDLWPDRKGRPLSFIAELDLAALRAGGGPDYLPAEGFLHVFYDAEDQPWGFDPEDRDGLALVFTATVADQSLPGPPAPDTVVFAARSLKGRRALSYPTPARLEPTTPPLSDADMEALADLERSDLGPGPQHRVGGYPSPIQNDSMEIEAELASRGVYLGDGSGYDTDGPDAERIARAEWRLLLQIDSDDDADMMWGDTGTLYVWIRERDARTGNFDRPWLILQCY